MGHFPSVKLVVIGQRLDDLKGGGGGVSLEIMTSIQNLVMTIRILFDIMYVSHWQVDN